MTPEQLRTLRESRGLTRDELAAELGGCTAQAIVKWERGERPIPNWVEEKMLSNVEIRFPLTDLHALLDFARESNLSFESFLSTAVREYLTRHRESKQPPLIVNQGLTAPTVVLPSNITPMPPQSIAADQRDDTSDIPPAIKTSYGSGKKKKGA